MRPPRLAGLAVALLALGIVAGSSAARAATPATEAPAGYRVSDFDVTAKANGRTYRIFVAAPDGEPEGPAAPVIYLLDANGTFPMMLAALAERPGARPAIVGIGYPTSDRGEIVALRYFDLTPETPAGRIPLRPGATPPETGGRDAFWRAFRDEIVPEAERRLPAGPRRRVLFGHSLGGLFALHVLAVAPGAFDAYVAADPSIWWNGHGIMGPLAAFASHPPAGLDARLLVLAAGERAERPGLSAEARGRLEALRSGPNGEDAASLLRAVPGLAVRFARYPGETHGSMLPRAVADALRFALEPEAR